MPQFTAFLRAINVGGRTVKMERLRELFASAGYADVKTYIASGNVIFEAKQMDAARLEREIEALLRAGLGFEVRTFVRSVAELGEIARYQPFPGQRLDDESSGVFVGFLKKSPPATAQKSVVSLGSKTDELHFHGRELYWLCHTRFSDSPISGALLERKLAMPMTLRNARTVQKIAAAKPAA